MHEFYSLVNGNSMHSAKSGSSLQGKMYFNYKLIVPDNSLISYRSILDSKYIIYWLTIDDSKWISKKCGKFSQKLENKCKR